MFNWFKPSLKKQIQREIQNCERQIRQNAEDREELETREFRQDKRRDRLWNELRLLEQEEATTALRNKRQELQERQEQMV